MSETDFLVARPSFIEGMARVLDLAGTLNIYNSSKDHQTADCLALRNDFLMIGMDIENSIEKSVQKQKK